MDMKALFTRKKNDPNAIKKQQRMQSANEFVNVKDIKGKILYSKDGYVFSYIKIQPISLELLSAKEKEKKIRLFASEFSSEKKDYKLFSISRPVDISFLTAKLSKLLINETNPIKKDLLNKEIKEVSNFAITGEVIERQFFLIIWEKQKEEGEREILKRANDIVNKFGSCDIKSEIVGQSEIVRLCNLFANPNYAHLEDGNTEPTIPQIKY